GSCWLEVRRDEPVSRPWSELVGAGSLPESGYPLVANLARRTRVESVVRSGQGDRSAEATCSTGSHGSDPRSSTAAPQGASNERAWGGVSGLNHREGRELCRRETCTSR